MLRGRGLPKGAESWDIRRNVERGRSGGLGGAGLVTGSGLGVEGGGCCKRGGVTGQLRLRIHTYVHAHVCKTDQMRELGTVQKPVVTSCLQALLGKLAHINFSSQTSCHDLALY